MVSPTRSSSSINPRRHQFPIAAQPAADQIEQPRIREDAFGGGTGEQADDA